MEMKQQLLDARAAVGTALHNTNTVLSDYGVTPIATLAETPMALSAVYAAGRQPDGLFANALKGTASGAAVTLPDVSPVPHEVAVEVTSKNLINPADITYGYELSNSKGQLMKNTEWYVTGWVPVKPSTTYYISGTSSPFRAEVDENFKAVNGETNFRVERTFTTMPNTRYCRFNSFAEGYDKPQLEEGSIETPYTPYISQSDVKVITYGKNLYKHQDYVFISGGDGGFVATKTETGFSITGSFSGGCFILVPLGSMKEFGGKRLKYSVKATGDAGSNHLVICSPQYSDRNNLYTTNGVYVVPPASNYPDGYILCVRFGGDKNHDPTAVVTYENIQVEFGDTATAYELYNERKEYAQGEPILSVSPSMSITTDTAGAMVSVEYNKDVHKAICNIVERLIALETAVVSNV